MLVLGKCNMLDPIICWTQKWRFGRCFSFSKGGLLGSMFMFQGVCFTFRVAVSFRTADLSSLLITTSIYSIS